MTSESICQASNLIWIDLEMTGLLPEQDRIIEVAVVVTDAQLEVVAQAPVFAIRQPDDVLESMDSWNRKTHSTSGLIERVRTSCWTEQAVSEQMCAFLERYVPKGVSPMCGNSICQDRRFLVRWMPDLAAYFHYRHIDVSTLKELCTRWYAGKVERFQGTNQHQALTDIQESIAELRYYRQHLFKPMVD